MFRKFFALFVLLSSTLVTNGLAQDKTGLTKDQTGDFCQRHPELWDKEGRMTLEGHKLIYLNGPEWWYNNQTKEWTEWPQENRKTLGDHKELYLNGPEWWNNNQTKDWMEWPQDKRKTLDCHKKIYLSGPQWWFDSVTKEWKPWPKSK